MIERADINAAAADMRDRVSTSSRVHADMYIGGRCYQSVSEIVEAAFREGARWAQERQTTGLTFGALSDASRSRVARWHSLDSWSPLEWAGAMCGEAGEAANFAKKLKRLTTGILNSDRRLGSDASITDRLLTYRRGVAHEVADTVVYGDLLCQAVDFPLAECVRHVFNEKSIECGFPERL